MEHNPLASFKDGLEITYSDLKTEQGRDFVVLYFERPNKKKSGFDSAKFIYPGKSFSEVHGFSGADLDDLMVHVNKTAHLAYEFSKEDAHATV